MLSALQNETIRTITDATWFVRNAKLQKDLKLLSLGDHVIHKLASKIVVI